MLIPRLLFQVVDALEELFLLTVCAMSSLSATHAVTLSCSPISVTAGTF